MALYVAKQWGGTTVIWDPRGSYAAAGIQCSNADELMGHIEAQDYIIEHDGKREMIPLVYHVDDDPEKSFDDLCRALFPPQFKGRRGRISVIVDESANLQSSQYISPALNRLVGQHPLMDVQVIQTAHEIREWNSKGKSVMDEMYLFHQIGPKNYERIKELCGEDVAEEVASFEPKSKNDPRFHYCVRYSFKELLTDDGKRWEVWEDPKKWFAPLGEQNRLPGNREKESGTGGVFRRVTE